MICMPNQAKHSEKNTMWEEVVFQVCERNVRGWYVSQSKVGGAEASNVGSKSLSVLQVCLARSQFWFAPKFFNDAPIPTFRTVTYSALLYVAILQFAFYFAGFTIKTFSWVSEIPDYTVDL